MEEARVVSPNSNMRHSIRTPRVRNITHVELDELEGCFDLGFGFNYEKNLDISNTFFGLELFYAIG